MTSPPLGPAKNPFATRPVSGPTAPRKLRTLSKSDFKLARTCDAKLFFREKPGLTQDNDFDTKNAKAACYERYSVGWTDPRGVYGTPGV